MIQRVGLELEITPLFKKKKKSDSRESFSSALCPREWAELLWLHTHLLSKVPNVIPTSFFALPKKNQAGIYVLLTSAL